MYWREKLRPLWGHLRLTDGMAYCHDYPLFFEKVAQLLTVGSRASAKCRTSPQPVHYGMTGAGRTAEGLQ
jgi:hypothetical protein